MKKIIAITALATLLVSCKVEPLKEFTQKEASIYFYVGFDENNGYNTVITNIDKNMATCIEGYSVVNVPVRCSGLASDRERKFKVAFDKEKSTAVEGVDFEKLPESFSLPAGEYGATIPVKLLVTDKLSNTKLILALSLQESNDFILGEKLRRNITITYSNMLSKPDNWLITYYKDYSRRKYQQFLIITGLEIFPTNAEITLNEYYYYTVVSRAMSKYFRDNYPVYDEETQSVIEPW